MAKNESKKNSNPLERAARLLDLVPYINTHQGIPLSELAEAFEVSTEQMVSDLTTLWMCGLPGYTPLELMDLEFESGYVTIRNAPTLAKPRSMTHEEGVALVLGLDLLRSTISNDRTDLLAAIDVLAKRIAELVNLPSALSALSHIDQGIESSIRSAISDRGGLSISYHSLYKDEITSREVLPVEIIESQGYSYLHAYCFTAEDFRHFRVDRIQSAKLIEVERPSHASTSSAEKTSFELRVVESSRDVAERFERMDVQAGSSFSGTSFSRHWIERSVLASGGAVELLSPTEIRSEVARRAGLILNRYAG